jgi:hypothetical protein
MCFMLYAGTSEPLPRREWNEDVPNLYVKSLDRADEIVTTHFSQAEVQIIGSTSGCGCNFPNATLTEEGWVGYPAESEAAERFNRAELVALLQESGEEMVELYGVWLDDKETLSKPEVFRENIALTRILEPTVRFKERGFYRVSL